MIDRKNRYGRTAARIHDADGLARRPPLPQSIFTPTS